MISHRLSRCLFLICCMGLMLLACKQHETSGTGEKKPVSVGTPITPPSSTIATLTTPTLPVGPTLISYPLSENSPFITSSTLSAIPRRLWDQRSVSDGPRLLVVLPSEEVSYVGGNIRCAGSTTPGAQVTINGTPAKMYPTGVFLGNIPWIPKPGLNPFVFKSTLNGKTTVSTINLREASTSSTLGLSGPSADGFRRLQPESDQELQVSDALKVRCETVPGGRVYFLLDKSPVVHEMAESKTRPGLYQGEYKILPTDRFQAASIQIRLESSPTKKIKPASTKLKATVSTLASLNTGHYIKVQENDTGLFSDTTADHRITSVQANTQLFSNGKIGKYYRVPLDKKNTAWVQEKQCNALPLAQHTVSTELVKMETSGDTKGRTKVSFKFQSLAQPKDAATPPPPLAYRVDTVDAGTSLTLTLWDTEASDSEITTNGPIRLVRCKKDSVLQLVRCEVFFAPGITMRGFAPSYSNGQLDLTIQTIVPHPEAPGTLRPLRIVLDPGHGGTDMGAVGAQGVCEADANLVVAYHLAEMLHEHGATVSLTRAGDNFVSLEDRIDMISKSDADLYLSIHCDSIGPFQDPLMAFGPRAYFYYAYSSALAQSLQTSLMGEMGIRGRAVYPGFHFFRPLRRCTLIPGALTEISFVSHPDDENRLIDPAFLDRVVLGLYKGIENYARR